MKRYSKNLFGLAALIFINVAVQAMVASPEIASFCDAHSMGAIHSLFFGDVNSAMVLANTPALTIQFSRNIESLPKPDDSFLMRSVDESQYVNGVKVVRPVAGGFPTVVTDPKSFPLKVQQKDDDSNEYAIKLHATLPQRISDWQELQQSYASRDGVLSRHVQALNHKIVREMMFNWSPTDSNVIVETSGPDKLAGLARFGATGNRKMITRDDILKAVQLFNEFDFDEDNHMLIPSSFKTDIRKIPEFVSYEKTGRPNGYGQTAIGEIEGCVVWTRSTGVIYNAAKTPVRVTTNEDTNRIVADAAACHGVLIWNAGSVYRALGKMQPYIDPKSGLMLGGTVNFSRAAGGNIRKDGIGVVAIVEKTS